MDNYSNISAQNEEKSYFEGNYFAYIGINLLVWFVSIVSFGIALPWMLCFKQRWIARNTVVCGKRTYFDGTGIQLIGRYILWSFLSVITFGIYGFWMSLAIKRWITKHTHFEGEEDNNSFFDGGIGGFIGTNILSFIVGFVPVVGFAWSKLIKLQWYKKHTVVDSRRFVFEGSLGSLFVKYLLWGLLTVVTLGIFAWFVPVKRMRWEAENTIDNEHTTEALIERSEYRTNIHTDAASFKTYSVENEMECVKSGISDAMSEAELLSLANAGNRAAMYEYSVRYANGNFTEEPFTSFLKASAQAEYSPAMSLYALTHQLEDNVKEEMLRKAAEKGQTAAIRYIMAVDAARGIDMPENKTALPVLKSALRYADLLKESGVELSEEEILSIKAVTLKVRKILCNNKGSNGSVAGIVIAIILGIILLLGAVLAASTLLFKRSVSSPMLMPHTNGTTVESVDNRDVYGDVYEYDEGIENQQNTPAMPFTF